MGAVMVEIEETELAALREKVQLSITLWRALLDAVDMAGMGQMIDTSIRNELSRIEAL